MAYRLAALNKNPGVQPTGICETVIYIGALSQKPSLQSLKLMFRKQASSRVNSTLCRPDWGD